MKQKSMPAAFLGVSAAPAPVASSLKDWVLDDPNTLRSSQILISRSTFCCTCAENRQS